MENRIHNTKLADLIAAQRPTQQAATPPGNAFQAILADRLKLSGHAQTRLQSREIQLQKEQWERVLGGVDRAEGKGARESLVMVDDVALVVSVKNRTVITAMDRQNLMNNVFTNIDSAVIV